MPRISIGDCFLHYEEQGSGEPLLLVPGLGGVGASFFKQILELAKHFRVIQRCGSRVPARPMSAATATCAPPQW